MLQVHQAVPSKGQRTVRYQLRSQRYLDRCAVLVRCCGCSVECGCSTVGAVLSVGGCRANEVLWVQC